ncbi:MAG: hypothetical protein ACR2FQ_10455 [Pseudonocardiaceae bacterium]
MRPGDVDDVLRVLVRAVPLLAETSDPPDETRAAARAALRGDLTAFARSDDILDVGEPGLGFFARFAPLYSRWTGRAVDLEADVAAPYRSVAGIDLAALRGDAARCRVAAAALEGVHEQLAGELGRLAARWTGAAAEAAVGHVAGVLQAVESVAKDVAAFAAVAGDLADAVAEQVRSRAEVVLAIAGDADRCGGLPHALVQRLIDVAQEPPDIAADGLARAVRAAVGHPGAVEQLVAAAVAERAASAVLLDGCFVPAFEARLALFRDEALTGVEDDLRGLWADVAASVVDGDPFAGLPVALPAPPDAPQGAATLGIAAPADGNARLGSAELESGAALGAAGPEGGEAALDTVPDPPAPERVAAVTPVPGYELAERAAREKLRSALAEGRSGVNGR